MQAPCQRNLLFMAAGTSTALSGCEMPECETPCKHWTALGHKLPPNQQTAQADGNHDSHT